MLHITGEGLRNMKHVIKLAKKCQYEFGASSADETCLDSMNNKRMLAADAVQSVFMAPNQASQYLNEHSNKLNRLQQTRG